MSQKRKPKKEGQSEKKSGPKLPALVSPLLAKALSHVTRQHILLAALQGEISTNELATVLGESLSQISYHVKVLHRAGLTEQTRTEPVRGATEHFYRATPQTLLPAKAWRKLKSKDLRAAVGASQASELFDDLAAALKAGKLRGESDYVARTPLALDPEGAEKVKAIAERAIEEAEKEQEAAAVRQRKASGEDAALSAYTFGVAGFAATWETADLRDAPEKIARRRAEANLKGDLKKGRGKKRRRS